MSELCKLYMHIANYVGFIGAQITNTLLLILLFARAEKLFGSYRHVMSVFAFYSLFYTWVEILTQPLLHIYGSMFIVMMNSPLKYETWIGNYLTCLYCGSFALCISLLASQFYYRYIAVCKPDYLDLIRGGKLFFIFIPCLIIFVLWTCCVYFGMANTVEKQYFMREVMLENYGEDITNTSFVGSMYWSIDENGKRIWRWTDIMGSTGCTCILSVCFSTIMFCAISIYRKLKDAQNIMSARTKELNRQLFITLTFQTVLPFVMMYSPVAIFIILPAFEGDIGKLANLCGASAGLYPAIEPLIAIFFIKDFRRTILCRGRRRSSIKPGMSNSETKYSKDGPSSTFH